VNIRLKVPIRVQYVGSSVTHTSNHFQKYPVKSIRLCNPTPSTCFAAVRV